MASSRKMFPKQFLPFDNKDSLFTKTLKRFKGGNFHKATQITFRFLVKDSVKVKIKLRLNTFRTNDEEYIRRCYIKYTLSLKKDPNAIILISISDHLVDENLNLFFQKF